VGGGGLSCGPTEGWGRGTGGKGAGWDLEGEKGVGKWSHAFALGGCKDRLSGRIFRKRSEHPGLLGGKKCAVERGGDLLLWSGVHVVLGGEAPLKERQY